jgi:hypothetical protein
MKKYLLFCLDEKGKIRKNFPELLDTVEDLLDRVAYYCDEGLTVFSDTEFKYLEIDMDDLKQIKLEDDDICL